jgi:Fic family protein
MARLVMSLILSRYSLPPIIIYAEDKQTYYGTMRLADAGNLRPFVRFCIDQLQKFYKEVKVRETDEEILDAELGVADNLNPE